MAPSITNYAEIQNDEIEVLRSIYMDDFAEEKSKTGAWNVRDLLSAALVVLRLFKGGSFHLKLLTCKPALRLI